LEIVTLIGLPKSIAENLTNRKCYLEKVCGKVLCLNCRIGNRYFNWFTKKHCGKLDESEMLS
jgi:hypothetical protein